MIPFDKEELLTILYQSDVKLTALTFIKDIKSKVSVTFSEAKRMLQTLIDEQDLSYHSLYGATYIEKSFLKPVRVSEHFILTPPGFLCQQDPDGIGIIMEQGISFGSGQHPTTRLSLQAIDFCFFERQMMDCLQFLTGADIGTGSGVLAMAMCLSGLFSCAAYEIDPVSIHEAGRNLAFNGLTHKITLIEDSMKEDTNTYSIICANLRFPTLTVLADIIHASLKKKGIAVLSGVRVWEKKQLINVFIGKGFELVWQKDEKNWSAFVLVKKCVKQVQ